MTFADYQDYDALGLAGLVRAGQAAPQELLDEALDRIEASNATLNAVTIHAEDQARRAIEAGLPQGPFTGVPMLLKDLYQPCAGLPVTNGSRFSDPAPASYDGNLAARYKRAGLVIFGRTNSPEFGLTTTTESRRHGAARNPWNPDYSTGGSSGGAAAAVAAGILPAAQASDGGGSIRIPASCCGLFGLKPTRGRVSLAPDAGEGWNGLAVAHGVTRSVRDSAALLDVAAGPMPGDPYWAEPPSRRRGPSSRRPAPIRAACGWRCAWKPSTARRSIRPARRARARPRACAKAWATTSRRSARRSTVRRCWRRPRTSSRCRPRCCSTCWAANWGEPARRTTWNGRPGAWPSWVARFPASAFRRPWTDFTWPAADSARSSSATTSC